MIKRLKRIYATIFLLALILGIASLKDYIRWFLQTKWASFILALAIMLLSLWGYYLVNKFTEIIEDHEKLKLKIKKKGKKK